MQELLHALLKLKNTGLPMAGVDQSLTDGY
jgi:hypothetical protein